GLGARQPIGADAGERGDEALRQRGAIVFARVAEPIPERTQPGARFIARVELGGALCGTGGNNRVASVGAIELQPDAAQLVDVARSGERLERERAQQALSSHFRKALVLGQQARGLQRFLWLLAETRG